MESFVYVFFIYALSVAFKHIGKALGVLLVVLQIPGASGLYPIEMQPEFFQALKPWLPFTYGINAMRESIAGFYGGKFDDIIMRGIDIFYSIPNILKAVVIVSLLGTSTINLIIALAISCATNYARIVRASVMTVRDLEYVESSYAMGLPTWKIILRHILPNCLSPIIVQTTLLIGTTIISASSLSFLGIGVPAPAPEWGALLSGGRAHIRGASYICVIPGLAIMFTVLALNLLGDGLRDALDPKLKK